MLPEPITWWDVAGFVACWFYFSSLGANDVTARERPHLRPQRPAREGHRRIGRRADHVHLSDALGVRKAAGVFARPALFLIFVRCRVGIEDRLELGVFYA